MCCQSTPGSSTRFNFGLLVRHFIPIPQPLAANGCVYVGEFRRGERHGEGVCTFPGGERYTGAWENGKMHGEGTLEIKGRTLSGIKTRNDKNNTFQFLRPSRCRNAIQACAGLNFIRLANAISRLHLLSRSISLMFDLWFHWFRCF